MASSTTYGRVDKFLHWLIALNITATLFAAFGLSELDALHKLEEYGHHTYLHDLTRAVAFEKRLPTLA